MSTPAEDAIRAEIAARRADPIRAFHGARPRRPGGRLLHGAAGTPDPRRRLPDRTRASPGLRGGARAAARRGLGTAGPARSVHARRIRGRRGDARPRDPRRPPRRPLAAGRRPGLRPDRAESAPPGRARGSGRAVGRPGSASSRRASEPGRSPEPCWPTSSSMRSRSTRSRSGTGRPPRSTSASGSGTFTELLLPPSTPAIAARLDALAAGGVMLEEGQRVELCLALDGWVADVAAMLSAGLVLVIDYGAPAPRLYGPRHRAGTLMTYRGHAADGSPRRTLSGRRRARHHRPRRHDDAGQAARRGRLRDPRRDDPGRAAGRLRARGPARAGAESRDRHGAALLLRTAVMRLLDPRHLGGFRAVLAGRGIAGRAAPPRPRSDRRGRPG